MSLFGTPRKRIIIRALNFLPKELPVMLCLKKSAEEKRSALRMVFNLQ